MRLAASATVFGLFVISTSAGMSSDSQDPNPRITEGAASDQSRSLMPVQEVAPVPAPTLQLRAGRASRRQGGRDRAVIERAIQALGSRRAAGKPPASAPQSVACQCANGGQFWRANCRQPGLVFLVGELCWSVSRHSAVRARSWAEGAGEAAPLREIAPFRPPGARAPWTTRPVARRNHISGKAFPPSGMLPNGHPPSSGKRVSRDRSGRYGSDSKLPRTGLLAHSGKIHSECAAAQKATHGPSLTAIRGRREIHDGLYRTCRRRPRRHWRHGPASRQSRRTRRPFSRFRRCGSRSHASG